jgi:hypothetical protein
MALYLAGKGQGAELYEIIAAADATNHAIPTTREMSRALNKFVQCGLVCEQDGRYWIADDYMAAIGKAHNSRGGLFASGDKGVKWLRETRPPAQGTGSVKLTDAEMKAAYDQYTKALRRRR